MTREGREHHYCRMQDTADSEALLAPLLGYAERFCRERGDGHSVASPLGAWLLLATTGTASRGAARSRIGEILGLDPAAAAVLVGQMLQAPHPAVRAAAVAWTADSDASPRLREWLSTLPRGIARGPLPSQAQADAWVADATHGLVSSFPVPIDELTTIVLANALAVKGEWTSEYGCVPMRLMATKADPRPWKDAVRHCLRDEDEPIAGIVSTAEAGDVALHSRDTVDGLRLFSVIAEEDVAPGTVMRVAHRLAVDATFARPLSRRSLFDLPLGESSQWTLTESERHEAGDREQYHVMLPAWSAMSTHALLRMPLGMSDAAAAIDALCDEPGGLVQAVQVAVARYHRTGFEAASVSGFGRSRFLRELSGPRGRLRRATLTYRHPFAVVAVAIGGPGRRITADGVHNGMWHGVPVFCAWVTRPDEIEVIPAEYQHNEFGE